MRTIINKIPILLVLVIFSVYYFILITIFPLFADDYIATLALVNSPLDYSKIITILSGIKGSLHGGPRLGAVLVFILEHFNRVYANIIMLLMVIVFNLLLFFYIFLRLPSSKNFTIAIKDAASLALIFMLQITITPFISEAILWHAGFFTHFFGQVLLLFTFIPFYLLFYNKAVLEGKPLLVVLFIMLCFIATFTTETVAVVFIVLMAMALIYSFIKTKKIIWGNFGGFLAFILGFLVVLYFYLFIGNRLKDTAAKYHSNIIDFFIYNLQRMIKAFTYAFHQYHIWLYLCLIILLFCLFKVIKNRKLQLKTKPLLITCLTLVVVLIFSISLLALKDARNPRVIHFQTFIIICTIMIFLRYLVASKLLSYKLLIYIAPIVIILFTVRALNIYQVIDNYATQINARNTYLITISKKLDKNAAIAVPAPKIMPNFKILKIDKSKEYYVNWELEGIRHYFNLPQKLINGKNPNITTP